MSLSTQAIDREQQARERQFARALMIADETGVADIATSRLLDELIAMPQYSIRDLERMRREREQQNT
jgi:hypothetical protein